MFFRAAVGALLLGIVTSQLTFTLSPENPIAVAGSNVIVTCSYSSPVPVTLVIFGSQQSPNYTILSLNLSAAQFSLSHVSRADNGRLFACQNSLYLSNNATLTVLYLYPASQFTSGTILNLLTTSQPIYLNVTFIANPLPNIAWYLNGTVALNGLLSAVGDTGVGSLYFPSLKTSNSGVYSVNISNAAGSYVYSITLNFTNPTITLSPANPIGVAGSNVIVTCSYSSPVPVTLVIFGSQQSPNYTILSQTGSVTQFSLNNVSRADNGRLFACQYSPYSSTNATLTVVYLYPASQFTSGTILNLLTTSQPIYLNVTFIANPLPNVVWYLNGTVALNGLFSAVGDTGVGSLYFPSLKTSNTGVYSVNISNAAGSYVYSITLSVTGTGSANASIGGAVAGGVIGGIIFVLLILIIIVAVILLLWHRGSTYKMENQGSSGKVKVEKVDVDLDDHQPAVAKVTYSMVQIPSAAPRAGGQGY